jgi:hypothetical protein
VNFKKILLTNGKIRGIVKADRRFCVIRGCGNSENVPTAGTLCDIWPEIIVNK